MLKHKIGFGIGNGLSRKDFDLNRIIGKGITVGCNTIYLDYDDLDYCVGLDHHQNTEMKGCIYRNWGFLGRWYDENKKCYLALDGVPIAPIVEINQGYNNNSGVMACAYLGQVAKVDTLYMLGFDFFRDVPDCEIPTDLEPDAMDLYVNEHKTRNDIYEGVFRQSKGLMPVWYLLRKNCPDTEFVRVGPIDHYDRIFYETRVKNKGFRLLESFEDMMKEVNNGSD